jgi:hypothetical protein
MAQSTGEGSAKAQEILKQARAAIGDESKIAGLKSISIAGSSRRVFGERETVSEVELEALMPDKIRRSTLVTPFPGAEIQNIEVSNGDQVWTDFVSNMPQGMGGGPGGPGGGQRVMVVGGGGGGDRVTVPGGGPGGPGGGPQMIMAGGGGDEASRHLAVKTEFTRIFLGFLAAPPANVHVEYTLIGEAKAPDGVADVIEVKGPGENKTRLYIDQATHRLLMLSYKGKDPSSLMRGGRGPGGPGGARPQGAPGQGGSNSQGPGAPAEGPRPAGSTQGPGNAPAGAPAGGQGQQGQPQMTPEEREARRQAQMKQMQEAMAKLPDVDFFWRFADYKSEGGLTLPRLVTKSTGGKINEEWQISKIKLNPNIKADKFEKKEKKEEKKS